MISVRRATDRDSQQLFLWRNDEGTRAASRPNEIIKWEDHVEWLADVFSDNFRFLYIAELEIVGTEKASVGMCRFDLDCHRRKAEVSINLAPERRGRGIAQTVLAECIATFSEEVGGTKVLTAAIRPSNIASVRLFKSVGFELSRTDERFNYYVLRKRKDPS